jgi:hypothetical protein
VPLSHFGSLGWHAFRGEKTKKDILFSHYVHTQSLCQSSQLSLVVLCCDHLHTQLPYDTVGDMPLADFCLWIPDQLTVGIVLFTFDNYLSVCFPSKAR